MTTSVSKPPRPPAKTAAERQKAYRQRRAHEAGEQRINTWVAAAAVRALNALAERQGLTQKIMLERLLLEAAHNNLAKPAERNASSSRSKPPEPTQSAAKNGSGLRQSVRQSQTAAKKAAKTVPANKADKADKARQTAKPSKEKIARRRTKTLPAQASLWDD